MAISKFNYNSFNVTPVAGKALAFNSDADGFTTASGSSMILIKTLTASSSGTLSFVDGADSVVLDDTYPVYVFKFINIHPSAGDNNFTINFRDGDTAYDATKTTTLFRSVHRENAGLGQIDYVTGSDLAQSTAAQTLGVTLDDANDSSLCGTLQLFAPSSTTFVKHFISRMQEVTYQTTTQEFYIAGYCNVTAAIDGVQFAMSSGNIDSGVIKLYGIKDS